MSFSPWWCWWPWPVRSSLSVPSPIIKTMRIATPGITIGTPIPAGMVAPLLALRHAPLPPSVETCASNRIPATLSISIKGTFLWSYLECLYPLLTKYRSLLWLMLIKLDSAPTMLSNIKPLLGVPTMPLSFLFIIFWIFCLLQKVLYVWRTWRRCLFKVW